MRKDYLSLLLICLPQLYIPSAHGVAYCALRDPVNTIYSLFPEADNYRSSVKTVGREVREIVLRDLPFEMHFNELGRHTLYVVYKEGIKVGFVHARSEMGEWGLTEYAWALTPDMKIAGVKVQRSRDPNLRRTSGATLSKQLLGKSLDELAGLTTKASPQMKTVLKSAMKTIVITQNVWSDETQQIDPIKLARAHLPQAEQLVLIDELYNMQTLTMLNDLEMGRSPVFDRSNLVGYKIQDKQGVFKAMAIRSPLDAAQQHRELLWIVADDGEIWSVHNVVTDQADPDFATVLGYAPRDIRDCSTLADIAALEIATLVRSHLVE